MDYTEQIEWLRKRLQEPLPGLEAQAKMSSRSRPVYPEIPEDARPSAVLGLLYPVDNRLHLLLIKRVADGKAHSGQISFPGGKKEPTDATLVVTALREAQEEVGVMSDEVDVLGPLSTLYIPVSNFQVHPFMGFAKSRPVFTLSMREVDHVLEIPLDELIHPDTKTVTDIEIPSFSMVLRKVNAYQTATSGIIWGATAMIIAELETILEEMPE